MTTVVNLKYSEYDIYIGRWNPRYRLAGSKWANPFKSPLDGTVEECIRKYASYLMATIDLFVALPELKGQRLGCWCKEPGKVKPCHGDLLAVLAEMSFEEAKAYLVEYVRNPQPEGERI